MASLDTTQQVSKDFRASMLTMLSESKGGILTDLGEFRKDIVGESTYFNRATDGTAVTAAPNLYDGTAQNTGGTYTAVKADPAYIYAYEQMEDVKFNKSMVNYKGHIPSKLVREIDTLIDSQVLAAIAAGGVTTNDQTAVTDLHEALKIVLSEIKGAQIEAADTPDKRAFVKVVINKPTAKKLFTLEEAINRDYESGLGLTDSKLFGAQLAVVKKTDSNLADGDFLIIPSMTLGFASFKGSDKTKYEYDLANSDLHTFIVKKSFSAVVVEPSSIVLVKTIIK